MNIGSLQADRSLTNASYLQTGDPGLNIGNTGMSGETNQIMQAYENIFGPAARDIKLDTQRHKRHQRWHLPDVLQGSNSFLTDRVDGLITDATSSPFTKNILPYMYMENPDQKIKWNVYSFDEGIASRVPYESAARVLPQSKRSFAGYAVPVKTTIENTDQIFFIGYNSTFVILITHTPNTMLCIIIARKFSLAPKCCP